MKPDPGYSPADERRDRADDRTQLIKVRAMAEALWREMQAPMHTDPGEDALKWCRLAYEEPLDEMLVDHLNPTIESLEE